VSLSILHVSQPAVDGVARCVTDLAADQVSRGHRVAVACPTDGPLAEQLKAVGAEHVTWQAGRSPGPSSVLEMVRLARIVRSHAPDLVHLHSSKAGLTGRLVLRGRRPTVFQPHAWSFFAARGPIGAAAATWERFATRWDDVVVCVSRGEELAGRDAGIEGELRVVPNGIDLDAFPEPSPGERDQARKRLGLADAPLAVCIGRLSEQKGQDVLVDAWPAVVSEVSGAELVLVGTGPNKEALRRRVRVTGEVGNVRDWLVAANLVVQPSRWEGLPYTVLEAMATGRAVVATDVPGMSDALGDDAALVRVEDRAALTREIARRLRDASASDQEGRALRERAERLFDLRTSAQAMADLYAEVLERRRSQ
jgi:glycosyltransferase involved in cell wall biosynthesis